MLCLRSVKESENVQEKRDIGSIGTPREPLVLPPSRYVPFTNVCVCKPSPYREVCCATVKEVVFTSSANWHLSASTTGKKRERVRKHGASDKARMFVYAHMNTHT